MVVTWYQFHQGVGCVTKRMLAFMDKLRTFLEKKSKSFNNLISIRFYSFCKPPKKQGNQILSSYNMLNYVVSVFKFKKVLMWACMILNILELFMFFYFAEFIYKIMIAFSALKVYLELVNSVFAMYASIFTS